MADEREGPTLDELTEDPRIWMNAEMDKLRDEAVRYREALEQIAYGLYGDWQAHEIASEQSRLARAALGDER